MDPYRERMQRGTKAFPFSHYRQRLSSQSIELHWHPEIELIYGISGKTAVTAASRHYTLKAGDILLISPKELHSYKAVTPEAYYHAAVFDASLFRFQGAHFFEEEFTKPLLNGVLKFPGIITPEHGSYAGIRPIVHRIFNEDAGCRPMLFADLTLLFSLLLRDSLLINDPDRNSFERAEDVKKCIRYMEEHYAEKITLSTLAQLLHMSPNYFCSYFKAQTGVTAFTQLNYLRVSRAADLLLLSNDSIVAIAETCGYENVSFFIRKFKEFHGCTPSVYRKRYSASPVKI